MQNEFKSSFPTLPYSEEQGERFRQDIRDVERRYQGKWDVNMLADYCWMLRRETEDAPVVMKLRNHPTVGIDHWGHGSLVVGRTGVRLSSGVRGRRSSTL
ncbi:hypothetical protein AVEN_52333-1 [Araneus ventricosus]|uniref:Uncharacterized protein n=1 Tax=Araneus ventricosus TaxID=182803 RepID=A0A4Y2QTN6_ARAVE|nr:hypothetical protein AVEN_52333-1 [Araneus ventricosus]